MGPSSALICFFKTAEFGTKKQLTDHLTQTNSVTDEKTDS